MSDTKISALTDGAPALTGDQLAVARAGANRRVTVGDVDTFVAANSLATHSADTTSVHGISDTSALATSSSVTSAIATHAALVSSVHGITAAAATVLDDASTAAMLTTLGAQPLDTELTALAGLTSAADKGIQFTGAGTAGTYDLTTAGKALLDDANAAAQRTTLGLGTAATSATGDFEAAGAVATHAALVSSVHGITAAAATVLDDATVGAMLTTLGGQPLDADLTAIAALSPSNDDIIQRKTGAWVNRTIAQLVTDLGLGSVYQPLDAELSALAGLTSAADKGIQFTGSGTAGMFDLTTAAKTVLDDATVAAMVDTLGGASSTGTGGIARASGPTFVAPILGTPASGNLVNCTNKGGRRGWKATSDNTFYWTGAVASGATSGTTALSANSLRAYYVICPDNVSVITTINAYVTTGVALTSIRFGIYATVSASDLYPGALIANTDSGALTSASNGELRTHTPGATVTLTPGAGYWFAIHSDGAPTLRSHAATGVQEASIGNNITASAGNNMRVAVAHTFGALPDPFTGSGTFVANAVAPLLGIIWTS